MSIMADIEAAVTEAASEEAEEDTSYAETEGWVFSHVPTATTWARRVSFYVKGKLVGEYAYVVRDDQGCHYVTPNGRAPYSRPIAIPAAALDRAKRMSKIMREMDNGLGVFLDAWEEINELMYLDGGV